MSPIGIGLIVIPTSTVIACEITISNKVKYEIVTQKVNNYKNQYEKEQQAIESFNKLNRKNLQDKVFDKIKYESLYILFIKYLEETRKESF